jgi:hypothetical protein
VKVVPPKVHETGGIRVLGTTVSVPCASGSSNLYVTVWVDPAWMSTELETSRVGPSGPEVTTVCGDDVDT